MSRGYPGWENWTPPVPTSPAKPKRAKYGAVPHVVLADLQVVPAGASAPPSAIRFDSKREAERFVELRQQQEIADFEYQRDGAVVVEDAKGFRNQLYVWKRKHAEAEHGIRIVEV